jgi:hypothetical protein
MCPACLTTTALMIAGASTTGGFADLNQQSKGDIHE